MTEKVKYVTLSNISSRVQEQDKRYNEILDVFSNIIKEEMKKNHGFVKLVYAADNGNAIFYYNGRIAAILGDLSKVPQTLETSVLSGRTFTETMISADRSQAKRIGHLAAGIMRADEYEAAFDMAGIDEVCRNFGWPKIQRFTYLLIDHQKNGVCLGGRKNHFDPAYVLPVHRCGEEMGLTQDSDPRQVAEELLKYGFVPWSRDEKLRKMLQSGDFFYELQNHMKKRGSKDDWQKGSNSRKLKVMDVEKDDNKEELLKKIKQHFQGLCNTTAYLPELDETIFQMENGSWDLWRFVGMKEESDLPACEDSWYDLSGIKEGLYARDPCESIASDAEAAAIDFGTKSTTVAISDLQGNIVLLPVGKWYPEEESQDGEMFENPTILNFRDAGQFMKDYYDDGSRPFTKFDDISVSYPAQEDFEDMDQDTNKNMFQYLNQLKQWVNDPRRKPRILDGKGLEVPLCNYGEAQGDKGIDPIEIYAYYIGLHINSMHKGKIYLKYLLSYSSTYHEESCRQIKESFERGLKKSLPYEVAANPELMKRFEVKLWCDEATAYAACAIKRCLMEDGWKEESQRQYGDMLGEGGILYGVYDFGGGTLDFGFGKFVKSQEEDEPDEITQWGVGGSSTLGCENILEELAFSIFNKNRENLTHNKVKCNKPPQFGTLGTDNFIGNSNQARLNTWELITCLRELWIGGKKNINEMDPLPLVRENGQTRPFAMETFCGGSEAGEEEETDSCVLMVEERYIERFFQNKVREGVELFFKKFEETVKENAEAPPKKCLIFLAGNASRSDRVRECMDSYLEQAKMSRNFIIIPPLPTELDKKLFEENRENAGGSIPNAKTGVVCGILLSREGSGDIRIEMKQPRPKFLYHIGYRIPDLRYPMGLFRLSAGASELPADGGSFRKLRKIPQKTGGSFQLLYTSNPEYCIRAKDFPVGQGVYIVQITVPSQYWGKFLYGRVKEGSVSRLELGISSQDDSQEISVEEVIGYCDLAPNKSLFVPYDGNS